MMNRGPAMMLVDGLEATTVGGTSEISRSTWCFKVRDMG